MLRTQSGFTLVELSTTLALIGIISAALIAVMTNLNTQSERMNSQTELLVGGKQIFGLIEPWAALAGHRQASPPLPENKAYEIVSSAHVKFCYDLDEASRQQREFRLRDKRLQERVENNFGCTVSPNESGWVDITGPIIRNLTFSDIDGSDYSLDMRVELEKLVPGTDEITATVIRRRFNMFAMTLY
jgi:prepilin-type N-terminal cleavage/methylation domain-containing protein